MNWIELSDGTRYDYEDPAPPSIEVIAKSLSRIARFGGHATRFLSVAEHSVRVAEWLEHHLNGGDLPMWGLLHDAHESVVGDQMRPLKAALESPNLRTIVDKFDALLMAREKLTAGVMGRGWLRDQIKYPDNQMLVAEAALWMPSAGEGWTLPDVALWDILEWLRAKPSLTMEESEHAFLATYHRLQAARL